MPTLDDAFRDVLARPVDDQPRLAYAALCDAAKDPRGAFIRSHIAVLSGGPRNIPAEDTVRQLAKSHGPAWAAPVSPLVDRWELDRGFVGLVRMKAASFLAHAPALFAKAPILHLELTDVKPCFAELLASEHLRRLRSLDLSNNQLDDHHAALLAASPNLAELRWLSLADNRIDTIGVGRLAESRNFPHLKFVRLGGNPSNPVERVSDDQGIISDAWLPPDGIALEKRLGPIPWLHFDWATTTFDLSPDPIVFTRGR